MSDLVSKICDWPYRNKFKASVLLSPFLYTTMAYVFYKAGIHSEEVETFRNQFIDYFHPKMIGLPFGIWCFLFSFSQVKQPRAKNFLKTIPLLRNALTMGEVSYAELERNIKTIEIENSHTPRSEIFFEAEREISQGKIGEALLKIASFLETYSQEKPELLQRILIDPFASGLSRIKTFSGNPKDQLRYLIDCTQRGRKDHVVKLLRSGYLEGDNLESKLLNAITLSSFGSEEEAKEIWESIYQEEKENLERLGETRNKILEIPETQYTKGIVIIKRGTDLRNEATVLRFLRKFPYDERITVNLLTKFKDGDEDVIIMYREDADNLDEHFNSNPEDLLPQAQLALSSLATLNTTSFPKYLTLQKHDPIADLERRFFARFGENPYTQRLRIILRELLGKIKSIPFSPLHRDAYPSNFLIGGKILDFEKVAKGLHWFDFETFVGHPRLQNYQKELAIHYMNQRSTEGFSQEGREVAALVSSTCQIGSFSKKAPELSRYFYERTLEISRQTGQRQLMDNLEAYLESRFSL